MSTSFSAQRALAVRSPAIPLVAGEELSEPAWALMAVFSVAGLAAGLTGIGSLLAAPRAARPSARS